MNSDKKIIAFDLQTSKSKQPYIETITLIIQHLDPKKYKPLILFYSGSSDSCTAPTSHDFELLAATNTLVYISNNRVEAFQQLGRFIDVLFVMDICCHEYQLLPNTNIVGMPHCISVYDGRPTLYDRVYHGKLKSTLNYFLHPLGYVNQDYIELGSNRASTPFYYVPAAYLKWDLYLQEIQKTKPNYILFIPTEISWGRKYYNIAPEFYSTVIERVLNSFPDQELVYRPHPNDRCHQIVAEIETVFLKRKNFSIDRSDDLKKTYAGAKVLLTDESAAGCTFSTLRALLETTI